jgi:hypothetical protein
MNAEIDPEKLYWISSSDGRVEMRVPGQCVLDLAGPGSVDDAAEYWTNALDWTGISDANIVANLEGYGCDWGYTDTQLNRQRFIWTATGQVYDAENPADHLA